MQILILLIFIGYFTSFAEIFSIGTYGVTSIDLLAALYYVIVAKKLLWDGMKLKFSPNPALLFLLAFLLVSIISSLSPIFKSDSKEIIQYFKSEIHLIFFLLFTLTAAMTDIKLDVWHKVIRMWLILSIFINIFGAYQIFARAFDLPFAWIDISNISFTIRGSVDSDDVGQLSLKFESFYRATSIFPEPSALSGFNTFIMSFLIIPYLKKIPPFFKSRFITILTFVCSCLGLFLAFSLTGILIMAIIIPIAALMYFSRKLMKAIPIAMLIIVMLLIADSIVYNYSHVSVISLFEQRISNVINRKDNQDAIIGESFYTRQNTIRETFKIWEEHPFLGVGTGQIQYNNNANIVFTDNGAMHVLAEMGLIGFICFAVMFAFLYYYSYNMARCKPNPQMNSPLEERMYSIALPVLIVLIITNFFTGNSVIGYPLWFTIALVFATVNQYQMKYSKKVIEFGIVKRPLKEYLKNYAEEPIKPV